MPASGLVWSSRVSSLSSRSLPFDMLNTCAVIMNQCRHGCQEMRGRGARDQISRTLNTAQYATSLHRTNLPALRSYPMHTLVESTMLLCHLGSLDDTRSKMFTAPKPFARMGSRLSEPAI